MVHSIWLQSVRCHARTGLLLLCILSPGVLLTLGGCRGSGPLRDPPAGETSPGPVEVVADWDDLDAAIDITGERMEMALVTATPDAPGTLVRRFELRSVAAEPVLLIVTRPAGGADAPSGPVPLVLNIKVGRFGDPAREARFLAILRERLGQLRGVDYRPLD